MVIVAAKEAFLSTTVPRMIIAARAAGQRSNRFDNLRLTSTFTQVRKQLGDLRSALAVERQSTSLGSRATRSGVWVGGGFVAQRSLQFISNLILTRLLFPEAFGLMALATVFLVGLAMFSDLGLKPAIIRDPRGNDPAFLNTAWTIQIIRGFVLLVIGCLLAYPISLIYEQPILFPLLAALSTTAAITGFASVKMATAERDLDFKTVTFVQIVGQAISIVIMVALAYYWRSVWSLAAGNIIGSIVAVGLGHIMLRGHRHRLQMEGEAARSLIHFGKWIFLSTIVTFLGGEGLRAVQAGFLTPAEFGILTIAYTIAAIPTELSIKLTGAIGLPALSEAYRDDPDRLSAVLHKFRKRVLTLSLAMVAAVVFISEFVVELLYDDRYHAAGALVVAITLANAINLIIGGYHSALLTLGKSQSYLSIMTFTTLARIVGVVAGFQMFGILGMIVGVGIANLVTLVMIWPMMLKPRLLDAKLDLTALISLIIMAYLLAFLI
jgi:O-antigen/teichoic acid export membrane protein